MSRKDGLTARGVARLKADATYPPVAEGFRRVIDFASDFAPCRCETHKMQSVPATTVDWTIADGRYHLRCLNCGDEWSRAAIGQQFRGNPAHGLVLDASHPEERAARSRR